MDITKEFEKAKEVLLRDGSFDPLLCVEFALNGIHYFPFNEFPFSITLERQAFFFSIGGILATRYKDDELRQVCFIVEMWTSARECKASQDPERKEALMAQVMNVEGSRTSFSVYCAEILRMRNTIDLLPYQNMEVVLNNLLPYLLHGFRTTYKGE
jgi:hypothetical protein